MKQKLTRALIDEIRKEMPVLTEMEMRCCNGGDGGTTSWDCLFNCMHHMDPSRSAQDYANDYKDIYGLDPTAMGGVPNELIGNVLSVMGFGNTVPEARWFLQIHQGLAGKRKNPLISGGDKIAVFYRVISSCLQLMAPSTYCPSHDEKPSLLTY